MTLATLILDSLYAGLALIAVGWLLDALHARLRRPASPFAWERCAAPHACGAPHFAATPAARERSGWMR